MRFSGDLYRGIFQIPDYFPDPFCLYPAADRRGIQTSARKTRTSHCGKCSYYHRNAADSAQYSSIGASDRYGRDRICDCCCRHGDRHNKLVAVLLDSSTRVRYYGPLSARLSCPTVYDIDCCADRCSCSRTGFRMVSAGSPASVTVSITRNRLNPICPGMARKYVFRTAETCLLRGRNTDLCLGSIFYSSDVEISASAAFRISRSFSYDSGRIAVLRRCSFQRMDASLRVFIPIHVCGLRSLDPRIVH